jgi:uncharacterized protein YndB with AHSA1/START domain
LQYPAVLAIAFLGLAPVRAFPAVADSSAGGYTVKITLSLKAAPTEVFNRLVRVADWWSSGHTWSGDARNLSLDPKPAGCFCEKLPEGGGVRHMEVVHVAPGKTLVMSGALGPLQSQAAVGNMTIRLAADGGGTKLDLMYAVAGYTPGGMNTWAAPTDGMLSEQMTRFQNYVEKGSPAAK